MRYDTGETHNFPFKRAFVDLAFSSDGRRLAVLEKSRLSMIDRLSGKLLFETDGGDIDQLKRLEFERNGKISYGRARSRYRSGPSKYRSCLAARGDHNISTSIFTG